MKFARIANGVVAEIIDAPSDQALAERYHRDIVVHCVACPDDAQQGWQLAGDEIVPPPPEPPISVEALRVHAGRVRYAVEVGGCAWGEHIVQTDRDSQAKLIAEFVAIGAGLRADPSPWKMAGGFVSLATADMLEVITTARAHIAAAFATEAAVLAAIEAGTVVAYDQIDEAFD
ncbi:MAG: DUF4376 domain-containing protein [Hyphomicrobiaceae bacterium]